MSGLTLWYEKPCCEEPVSRLCSWMRLLSRFMRAGADLLSGVYHWGVDNYGDGATPVVGSQIAGFQVSPTMQAKQIPQHVRCASQAGHVAVAYQLSAHDRVLQAHHQRPWTITQRQFANNVHKV